MRRRASRSIAFIFDRGLRARDVDALRRRAWSSQPSEDSPARRAAEAEAARKLNAKSSPLFSWTEVDISNSERHIPRWQNAAFILAVVSLFGYFGHKMVYQELNRRERTAAAAARATARAKDAIRAGVRGVNFAKPIARDSSSDGGGEDDDPFDGFTPEEIQKLVARHSATASADDDRS